MAVSVNWARLSVEVGPSIELNRLLLGCRYYESIW